MVIGAIQAERSTNAAKINDDYTHVITEKAYDACSFPRYELDPEISVERFEAAKSELKERCDDSDNCYESGTNWSYVWTLNAVMMLIQAVNYLILMVGACFFYPRFVGAVCNCLLSCIHLIAVIAGFIYSGNTLGIYCSYNIAPVDYEGKYRFNSDGATY